MRTLFLFGLVIVTLAACTWVKTTPEGEGVQIATMQQTRDCEKLGDVNVSLKHKVGRVERKPEKVATELETLARNEGALMGGNTVAPVSKSSDGRQTFGVFNCPQG